MLRAHDLGFRDVMQHTRTFGAAGCSPRARNEPTTPEPSEKGGDDESPECGKGSPEDPGTFLGA